MKRRADDPVAREGHRLLDVTDVVALELCTLPGFAERAARARGFAGRVLTKTSSPKLTEPQLSVAISGRQASGCARSSRLMPTAPPVEVWTMQSVFARMASMASANRSRDCVGVPSSLRTWR